jgi:hypothetical protein
MKAYIAAQIVVAPDADMNRGADARRIGPRAFRRHAVVWCVGAGPNTAGTRGAIAEGNCRGIDATGDGKRIASEGSDAVGNTAAEFSRLLSAETANWSGSYERPECARSNADVRKPELANSDTLDLSSRSS